MLRGSVRRATGQVQASRVVPQASSAPGRIVLAAVREDSPAPRRAGRAGRASPRHRVGGAHTDRHCERAGPRSPAPSGSTARVPASATGTTGRCWRRPPGRRRGGRPAGRGGAEGALGEEQQWRTCAGSGGERVGVLDTMCGVETTYEMRAHALEQRPQQAVVWRSSALATKRTGCGSAAASTRPSM